MLRTPLLWGNEITVEGDENDAYFRDLPDHAPFHDGVLELLGVLLSGRESASVIDVGANVGIHSLGLAALAPGVRVVAIEANPRTARWLELNAQRNTGGQVTVVQRAISDEPGSLSFCDNHEFAAGSMPLAGAAAEFVDFLKAQADDRHEVIEVPAVRLDDLVTDLDLPGVDVLKIDVEGHDIRVVRGAQQTIARFRPVVVMEFATLAISLHAGMLPSDVLREVRDQFERVYVTLPTGKLHEIANDADAIGFLEGNAVRTPVQDLVCVPAGCPLADAVHAQVTDEPAPTAEDHRWNEARELDEARRQVRELQQDLQTVTAERDDIRKHATQLEQTLSWRITAPLRSVRRLTARHDG